MKTDILLVTGSDETYRRPLLEAQGYSVHSAQLSEAMPLLRKQRFHLVLVTTENGVPNTLAFCTELKKIHPDTRVGVLAERAEYVPKDRATDIVIRLQYSPAKFVGAINTLLQSPPQDRPTVIED